MYKTAVQNALAKMGSYKLFSKCETVE